MSGERLDAIRPGHERVRVKLKRIHALLSEAYQAGLLVVTGIDWDLTDQRAVDARVLLELISTALQNTVQLRSAQDARRMPYRPPPRLT